MNSASLFQTLRQAASRVAERTSLCFGNRLWTYADLYREVDAIAAGLAARGLQRGDRVAFLLPNGPELIALNLACLKNGLIAVPLNNRLKGSELAFILQHCRAKVVVVHGSLYESLEPVRTELKDIAHLFFVGADSMPTGCESFESLRGGPLADSSVPTAPPDQAVAILYTSGTTARPKGVTHTGLSLGSTVRNYVAAVGMNTADIVFGMLSMSHVFGYTAQLLSPLSVGATIVVSSEFDAPRVFEMIARLRVTHLYGLPVMFDSLTREMPAEKPDLASLTYCLAGGDSVPRALTTRMRDILGLELHEGCGMTEVIPYTLNRPGFENRVGSIGPASIGIELRLVDLNGRDVEDGETGEILVRGEAVTAGYWEDSAATSQAFHGGWFRTGDLGRRDRDGYYWFVGRSKEIIVRGGSNISPLEVEETLARHPSVQEVAVVGVPHPALGETVAAFAVLRRGSATTPNDLRQFASEHIAAYKVPEQIEFLEELPRGLTGKVHRKALRDRVARRVVGAQ